MSAQKKTLLWDFPLVVGSFQYSVIAAEMHCHEAVGLK